MNVLFLCINFILYAVLRIFSFHKTLIINERRLRRPIGVLEKVQRLKHRVHYLKSFLVGKVELLVVSNLVGN